jgi:hypothetical protein
LIATVPQSRPAFEKLSNTLKDAAFTEVPALQKNTTA